MLGVFSEDWELWALDWRDLFPVGRSLFVVGTSNPNVESSRFILFPPDEDVWLHSFFFVKKLLGLGEDFSFRDLFMDKFSKLVFF